jgi:penicillin-binding protein 1C
MDPRIPDALEVFPFLLPKELRVMRVDWLVDGHLVGSTGRHEHRFFWPLARGTHTVQAHVWQAEHGMPVVTPAVEFVVK